MLSSCGVHWLQVISETLGLYNVGKMWPTNTSPRKPHAERFMGITPTRARVLYVCPNLKGWSVLTHHPSASLGFTVCFISSWRCVCMCEFTAEGGGLGVIRLWGACFAWILANEISRHSIRDPAVKLSQQRTQTHSDTHIHTQTQSRAPAYRCVQRNALDSCRSEAVVLEARCLAVIQTSLKRQAQRSTAVQSYCIIMCFFSRGAHNFLRSCRKEWQIRSL